MLTHSKVAVFGNAFRSSIRPQWEFADAFSRSKSYNHLLYPNDGRATHFRSHGRRASQPNTVPDEKFVQKMWVPDTWWSSSREFINGPLHTQMLLLNQIAADEETSSIEAVVAMDTYEGTSSIFGFCRSQLVDQSSKF